MSAEVARCMIRLPLAGKGLPGVSASTPGTALRTQLFRRTTPTLHKCMMGQQVPYAYEEPKHNIERLQGWNAQPCVRTIAGLITGRLWLELQTLLAACLRTVNQVRRAPFDRVPPAVAAQIVTGFSAVIGSTSTAAK